VTRFLSSVFLLCLAAAALALEPGRALTQARMSVWTADSGLPQSSIYTIVQTRDGYLWMGTEEGLVRFDGARFVVFDRQTAPGLRSSFVSALFEAADGTLWVGTYGSGIARFRNGRLEPFRPDVVGSDRIRDFHAMRDGSLYVTTAGGGLLHIKGENVTRFTMRDGLPADRLWYMQDDGAGGLWISTFGAGVVRWRDSRVVQQITTRDGLKSDLAHALLRDASGTLWIGTDGGGLAAWRDGAIVRTLTTKDGLPSDFVRTARRDRDGSLWIGTDGGLARWRGGRADALTLADGLPSIVVPAVLEDREGSLWIGTNGGLVRLSDTRVLSYTRKEGLTADGIRAVLEDERGHVWLGTEGGGLCEVIPGSIRCLTKRDGLPYDNIYALARSAGGGIWIGTDGGGVTRLTGGRFEQAIDTRNGLPNDRIRAIVEAPDRSLWISTTNGLAHVRDGKASRIPELDGRQLRPLLLLGDGTLLVGTDGAGLWKIAPGSATAKQIATTGHGLESDRVFSLAADAHGGGAWIGTSGGGLARLDFATDAVRSVTRRMGLHDDVVFQVVDEGVGRDLWLTSNHGVYRVSRDAVLAAMRGQGANLAGIVYGKADGLPSAESNGAFPAAIRAHDGRLWFATARGVGVIEPRLQSRNTVPPPTLIEDVLVDGMPGAAPARGVVRVPPGTQHLDLRYTALSLRSPELVTFRYLLGSYDRDWIDAGTSRVAHYTKLEPGDYTFRVIATNEDGVRSRSEATLLVTVAPQWFETWWARLAAVAIVAAAAWAAMRLRVAAIRARKNEELARAYENVHRIAAELEDTNRQLGVANVRLRALSYLDGLTGVANRRRFDEALEEACASAREKGKPLSLVLIDLDHFKRLNDAHGHHHGDDALRGVGALLAERTASRGGLAARFGGEEFAWLLPGFSLDAAQAEAEALRLLVRDAGMVTASVGVSSNAGTPDLTPFALIAAADSALYRAKSRGRDRVEVAV
jgi:diguanylate cyclase (GGDEF)-like protein